MSNRWHARTRRSGAWRWRESSPNASDLRDEDFEAALRSGWWAAYEIRNKARNGLLATDVPRAIFHGWEFAYACAMRIALRERRPYESDRTIWADVSRRGYGMPAFIAALTGGDTQALLRAMDAAWQQVGGWGAPESAPVR